MSNTTPRSPSSLYVNNDGEVFPLKRNGASVCSHRLSAVKIALIATLLITGVILATLGGMGVLGIASVPLLYTGISIFLLGIVLTGIVMCYRGNQPKKIMIEEKTASNRTVSNLNNLVETEGELPGHLNQASNFEETNVQEMAGNVLSSENDFMSKILSSVNAMLEEEAVPNRDVSDLKKIIREEDGLSEAVKRLLELREKRIKGMSVLTGGSDNPSTILMPRNVMRYERLVTECMQINFAIAEHKFNSLEAANTSEQKVSHHLEEMIEQSQLLYFLPSLYQHVRFSYLIYDDISSSEKEAMAAKFYTPGTPENYWRQLYNAFCSRARSFLGDTTSPRTRASRLYKNSVMDTNEDTFLTGSVLVDMDNP
ncbi:hypothetical protein CP10139811_0181 [Chlamydia ibidis]|uniref:Uncharacterized protein n=2 Tax=Chlamydia ibidis TaxID=1405396 RepID=S7KGL7_9CHLA|nr:hypothetical protein [Chlamydia ibidis]EPP35301.1 hypothetical protein CP10139811_0181 [Chlamydia ibidis]EQM62719.1 hypothetical protein H359_0624 [Chlamydia ibidis 10-1398/6]